jgi:hypothetical protein
MYNPPPDCEYGNGDRLSRFLRVGLGWGAVGISFVPDGSDRSVLGMGSEDLKMPEIILTGGK